MIEWDDQYEGSLSADGNVLVVKNREGCRFFDWVESRSSWVQRSHVLRYANSRVYLSGDGNTVVFYQPTSIRAPITILTYNLGTNSWIVKDEISNANTASISINGDGSVLAIGRRPITSFNNGTVEVYHWDDSNYTLSDVYADRGYVIHGPDPSTGASISLSGNGHFLAVGSPNAFDYGRGLVRIYALSTSNNSWYQLGNTITLSGYSYTNLGSSVTVSNDGNIVAIGAVYDDGSRFGSRRTLIFEYNSETRLWTQKGSTIIMLDILMLDSATMSSDGSTVVSFISGRVLYGNSYAYTKVYRFL